MKVYTNIVHYILHTFIFFHTKIISTISTYLFTFFCYLNVFLSFWGFHHFCTTMISSAFPFSSLSLFLHLFVPQFSSIHCLGKTFPLNKLLSYSSVTFIFNWLHSAPIYCFLYLFSFYYISKPFPLHSAFMFLLTYPILTLL